MSKLSKASVPAGRRSQQRGSALLEASLIFLPMMAIFLGIVDISLSVFIQSTLTTATREGTRFGITYGSSYNGNSCVASQARCIIQAAEYNAVGLPTLLSSGYITVNYYTANNLSTPVMYCTSAVCTANNICGPGGASACTNGSMNVTLSNGKIVNYVNQPGNVVEVVVAGYPWNWLIPLPGLQAGTGITLGAASMDILGGLAVGSTSPPSP